MPMPELSVVVTIDPVTTVAALLWIYATLLQ